MNTNQVSKSISELVSLVEEQHFYQHTLFSEISENTVLEYAPLVSASCVAFAKKHFKSIEEAVDYIVETAEARHKRRLDSISCLSVVGVNNSSYYTDRVYNEAKKIHELINSDE